MRRCERVTAKRVISTVHGEKNAAMLNLRAIDLITEQFDDEQICFESAHINFGLMIWAFDIDPALERSG